MITFLIILCIVLYALGLFMTILAAGAFDLEDNPIDFQGFTLWENVTIIFWPITALWLLGVTIFSMLEAKKSDGQN